MRFAAETTGRNCCSLVTGFEQANWGLAKTDSSERPQASLLQKREPGSTPLEQGNELVRLGWMLGSKAIGVRSSLCTKKKSGRSTMHNARPVVERGRKEEARRYRDSIESTVTDRCV